MTKLWLVLRSSLFMLGYALSTLVFALISLPLWAVSRRARYAVMVNWARFVLWWLKVTCGLTYRVHGPAVWPDQPAVALVRHESAWETLALQMILPRQAWVLKRELLRIPFFGWGLATLWPIAIDRGAGRAALKQVLEQGQQRLADGAWVVVFPEGTRMAPGVLGKMNVGGALLAEKAQAPVVMVTHNAGRFWAKGAFIKYPGVIDVFISDPVAPGHKAQRLLDQTEQFFRAHGVDAGVGVMDVGNTEG